MCQVTTTQGSGIIERDLAADNGSNNFVLFKPIFVLNMLFCFSKGNGGGGCLELLFCRARGLKEEKWGKVKQILIYIICEKPDVPIKHV